MMSVLLFRSKTICLLLTLIYAVMCPLFNVMYVTPDDQSQFMKVVAKNSIMKFTVEMIVITVYGFNRCPPNQTSRLLFMFKLDDNKYWENSGYVWAQIFIFKAIALVTLIIIQNLDHFDYKHLIKWRKFQNNTNEIELSYGNILGRFSYLNDQDELVENSQQHITIECSKGIQIKTNQTETKTGEYSDERNLSLGWIDMTLRAKKTFYSEKKVILREIKGFLRFGSITALMGPSGAGKSSLLRALNGLHRSLIAKNSKILLSKTKKISICFIAQDQREHIIKGLTVTQAIYYASKLKNTGTVVDHNMNVNELMNDLVLNEIKDNNIEKCSSGEQKRIVLAMELSAEVKPNLICVDEPTSGIDNSTAFEVRINS